jgi:hypothetical protein
VKSEKAESLSAARATLNFSSFFLSLLTGKRFIILAEYFHEQEGEIMKYCPNCQTRYTDNTLRFCLQDGAPLVAETTTDRAADCSAERNRNARRAATPALGRADYGLICRNNRSDSHESQTPPISSPSECRAAEKIENFAARFADGARHAFAGAALGAWLYLKNNRADGAKNTAANVGAQSAESNANSNSNVKYARADRHLPKNEN